MIADMKKVTVYHNGRIVGLACFAIYVFSLSPRPFCVVCGQV